MGMGSGCSTMTVMPIEYDRWLDEVRDALRSINMSMDDWQSIWPFDFKGDFSLTKGALA
jgi:hypothetical protein